jgi:hypothetical protein
VVLAATEKSNPVHIAASSPICAGRSSSSVHSTLVIGADMTIWARRAERANKLTNKMATLKIVTPLGH